MSFKEHSIKKVRCSCVRKFEIATHLLKIDHSSSYNSNNQGRSNVAVSELKMRRNAEVEGWECQRNKGKKQTVVLELPK